MNRSKTYESLLSQVRERRCTRSGQMLLARHLAAAVVEHHPEQHQFELFLQRTLVHGARWHAHFGRHCGECMICLFCYPCCFIQNTCKLIPFVCYPCCFIQNTYKLMKIFCLLPVLFYSKHNWWKIFFLALCSNTGHRQQPHPCCFVVGFAVDFNRAMQVHPLHGGEFQHPRKLLRRRRGTWNLSLLYMLVVLVV